MNVSLTKKMFVLVALALLMWIPLLMIENTVSERAGRRDSVQQEVAASVAGEQEILGPMLVVPYTYFVREWVKVGIGKEARKEERLVERSDSLQIIPHKLSVSSQLTPVILERGIFRTVTYQSETSLEGEFKFPAHLPHTARTAVWQDASLSVGIKDARGLSTTPAIEWNHIKARFEPGVTTPLFDRGVKANVGLLSPNPEQTYFFKINLSLRGTKRFHVAPIAQQFEFDLRSAWPHPSFIGNYLPDSRTVSSHGFNASWRLTDFATHARQIESCLGQSSVCAEHIRNDSFGVALIDPVDNYLQAERAIKYGFLFIILTFSAVFLTETLRKQAVHPIQYLLTGVSLAMFFLLVLAFSEHVSFAMAYGIASTACVSLIGFYLSFALASRWAGMSSALLLGALYVIMYQLLRSEDSALLLGSSLLFGLLAIAMIITRRVNWFDLTAKVQSNSTKVQSNGMKGRERPA